jgi:hypothetical protein
VTELEIETGTGKRDFDGLGRFEPAVEDAIEVLSRNRNNMLFRIAFITDLK